MHAFEVGKELLNFCATINIVIGIATIYSFNSASSAFHICMVVVLGNSVYECMKNHSFFKLIDIILLHQIYLTALL